MRTQLAKTISTLLAAALMGAATLAMVPSSTALAEGPGPIAQDSKPADEPTSEPASQPSSQPSEEPASKPASQPSKPKEATKKKK